MVGERAVDAELPILLREPVLDRSPSEVEGHDGLGWPSIGRKTGCKELDLEPVANHAVIRLAGASEPRHDHPNAHGSPLLLRRALTRVQLEQAQIGGFAGGATAARAHRPPDGALHGRDDVLAIEQCVPAQSRENVHTLTQQRAHRPHASELSVRPHDNALGAALYLQKAPSHADHVREERQDRATLGIEPVGQPDPRARVLNRDVPEPDLPSLVPGVPWDSDRTALGGRKVRLLGEFALSERLDRGIGIQHMPTVAQGVAMLDVTVAEKIAEPGVHHKQAIEEPAHERVGDVAEGAREGGRGREATQPGYGRHEPVEVLLEVGNERTNSPTTACE